MRRSKLNLRREEIINRYEAGESCGQIARSLAVRPNAVWMLLKRNNVEMRPQGCRVTFDRQRMIELRKQGMTCAAIARELGCSTEWVRQNVPTLARRKR